MAGLSVGLTVTGLVVGDLVGLSVAGVGELVGLPVAGLAVGEEVMGLVVEI